MLPLNVSPSASTRPQAGSRVWRLGPFLGLATAALILTGCDLPSSSSATGKDPVRPSELTAADGQPCPQELPIGDDPSDHGFGTQEVATTSPTLLEPQEAWVCKYHLSEVGTTPEGDSVNRWRREGQPKPVPAANLSDLQAALDDLAPADRSGGCTADLGPRWMVVYSNDGDLTGVVVDNYGCREVRLTDNPHKTPPGADGQDGTVGGVLDNGFEILDALTVVGSR